MKSSAAQEILSVVRLAAPVIVSQFAANAIGLVSTAVIGRLGSAELAAAAYGNAIYYLFFVMLQGVMLSVSPRVAQAHGAGDGAAVRRVLWGGLWLAVLLALAAFPVMQALAAALPHVAPPDLDRAAAAQYVQLYALGMLPVLLFTAMRGALEGTGQPGVVTRTAVTGVVLVAVLSPALAFGWGPLPRLGLPGAALSSACAQWAMFAALLVQVLRRWPDPAGQAKPDWAEVKANFRLGWPIGLTLGAEAGMFSLTSLQMARFGPDALAAHNVAFQIITALFMVPLGLATATSIRVAQAAGASSSRAGARRAGLLGIGLGALVMLLFAAVEWLAPQVPVGVFVNLADPRSALCCPALLGCWRLQRYFRYSTAFRSQPAVVCAASRTPAPHC
ncbi:MATE family efflux transporter [Deinococcus lacus]|uniref:MATE family efflux transporter n=1 Tax=Deinococcus lacus TaxID=392561 RepID=A0ABW1YGZ4_9DEIO